MVGNRVIPVILDRIAATRSRELFTLTVLAIALGLAVGAALVFGVSMALGAFLAGMIVGRSDYSLRAATDALPMRDAFAVLFFVSVGMLLRPMALLEHTIPSLAALFIVLVGKPATAALVTWLMKLSAAHDAERRRVPRADRRVLVHAHHARPRPRRRPAEALDVVVATAIISITLNPLAFRSIEPLDPQARTQIRFLRPEGFEPSDVGASSSLDPGEPRDCDRLRADGTHRDAAAARERHLSHRRRAEYRRRARAARAGHVGGVRRRQSHDTLVSAGLPHASTLIVSGADTGSPDIIQCARSINPTVHIFVRSSYLRDVPPLRQARRRAGVCRRRRGRAGDDRSGAATSWRDARSDRSRARACARGTDAALLVVSGVSRTYIFFSASRTLRRTQSLALFAFTYRSHLLRIRPRVLRSAQPIALRMKNCLSARFGSMQSYSSFTIRLSLESELTQDRGASLPHVLVARPAAHQLRHASRFRAQDVAQTVASDRVDEVPPRAGDDHLLEHRHRRPSSGYSRYCRRLRQQRRRA